MNTRKTIATVAEEAKAERGGRKPLADYLGVTPNAVTEWCKGRAVPNAEHLLRMLQLTKRISLALFAAVLFNLASTPDAEAALNITISDASFAGTMLIVSNVIKGLFRWLTDRLLTPSAQCVR